MKIIKKILILTIISICMANIFQINLIYAKTDLSTDIGKFEADITTKVVTSTKSLKQVANRFLGFLRIISALILVIILGTTGYEYIVATPDVRGEIKKKMLPIILGIILVFAAVSIASFILKSIGG